MKRYFSIGFAASLLLLAGCGFAREPQTEPVLMSRAEAWRSVNEPMELVYPRWKILPLPDMPIGSRSSGPYQGCSRDDGMMSAGPPWRVEVKVDDLPSDRYELLLIAESFDEKLIKLGYKLEKVNDDPLSRRARSRSDFTIELNVRHSVSGAQVADLTASSPCLEFSY